MRSPRAPEACRLDGLLETALLREARLWKVPVFRDGSNESAADILSSHHQQMVIWLGEMSRLFQFCPETFALGVCILNRLLFTVKAQPKYLKCIAFTSLVLAAKINEEDEVIGSVKDLVVRSGCNFSTAEILRMEKIILDKLHWDLYTATPVDFVQIFHALLLSGHPHLFPSVDAAPPIVPGCQNMAAGLQVALWTRQVQHCMACHQLWQFKGSTLALAIITLELEALTPDWFSVFTDLLKKAQVDSAEFIHCKEMVDEYLRALDVSTPTNAVYIFDGVHVRERRHRRKRGWRRPGRNAEHFGGARGDSDEFYDGLRRLYEETNPEGGEEGDIKALMGVQKEQMSVHSCPPLHPAAAVR